MPTPVILITGASRGIGAETARLLSSQDNHLVLVARTPLTPPPTNPGTPGGTPGGTPPGDIGGTKGVLSLAFDLAQPAAAPQLISQIISHFGRLDAIVHCAGSAPQAPLESTSDDLWRHTLDSNLSSAFYLAKAAWPHLKQQGGTIVLLSSEASRDPFDGFAAYASAKAGLNLLAQVLAKEGLPHHIRVHTLAPAAVETQMFRSLVTPEQWPKDKTLSPTDVAQVILDCLSGRLAHTTGEVIWLHKTL